MRFLRRQVKSEVVKKFAPVLVVNLLDHDLDLVRLRVLPSNMEGRWEGFGKLVAVTITHSEEAFLTEQAGNLWEVGIPAKLCCSAYEKTDLIEGILYQNYLRSTTSR